MSNTTTPSVETPAKKSTGYKWLALLLLAVCVGVLFLPINVFTGIWSMGATGLSIPVEKHSLVSILPDLLGADGKVLGFLPALVGGSSILPLFITLSLYGFVIALIVTYVLIIVAFCVNSKTVSLVRAATFCMTWGAAIYALSIVCVTNYFSGIKTILDLYTVLLAVFGTILYFILMCVKLKKDAVMSGFQFLLTVVVSGFLLFAIADDGVSVIGPAMDSSSYSVILTGIALFAVAHLVVASFCAMFKPQLIFDIVRFTLQLVVVVVALIMCFVLKLGFSTFLLYTVFAAVVAAIQLVLAANKLVRREKKEIQEQVDKDLATYDTVQFIETYDYDGGPVAGVLRAREVHPTLAAIDAVKDPEGKARETVATLLGNGFDPFLITLDTKQKEEFIDLYVLRCKGLMPEIPGYVVGGDNKEFFTCVFIYLGQYRQKIPADLLEKMYNFSMKI